MGARHAPLRLVETLDLERYAGRWYEVARLPNRFQRRCASDVSAFYTPLVDGRVQVDNRCRQSDGAWRESRGIARRAPGETRPAALEVRFAPRWLSWLPQVWGDYRVMALGSDYEYSMVGTENRRYLWILSRKIPLPRATLDPLFERAREEGFDPASIEMTRHDDA